jgi:hypothetical protein
MARRKYVQGQDNGEWFTPQRQGFRLRCCDCKLVHTVDFRVNMHGQIQMRMMRDVQATAASRRKP